MVVRVGIIGCGEIAQVSHIPALNALSDLFKTTYLCDVSQQALEHCASKVANSKPQTTTQAQELCCSPDVDAVLICNSTAFHVAHALLALENDKNVLVEKPLALCYRDIDILASAEAKSKGKLFVGYMRRYAPALQRVLDEIDDKILYARVRDIIGPNSDFVSQSGMYPKKFTDFSPGDSAMLSAKDRDIHQQAMSEFGIPSNDDTMRMLMILGGLGTHDLSAMREVLGMPSGVTAACLRWPIWSAILDYGDFSVTYESGINEVPVFDAHIEVYTPKKIVRVEYDTPYVKGLPTNMRVREKIEIPNGQSGYQDRLVRLTYEDSYTLEFKTWYDCIMNEKRPKTSIEDARQDVDIIRMLMQSAYK